MTKELVLGEITIQEPVTPHAEWFVTGTSNLYKPNYHKGSSDGTFVLASYSTSSATILKKCSCIKSTTNFGGNESITVKNPGDVINNTSENRLWVLINDQD